MLIQPVECEPLASGLAAVVGSVGLGHPIADDADVMGLPHRSMVSRIRPQSRGRIRDTSMPLSLSRR